MSLTLSCSRAADAVGGQFVYACCGTFPVKAGTSGLNCCHYSDRFPHNNLIVQGTSSRLRIGEREYGGTGSRIEGVSNSTSLLLEVLSPQNRLLGADFSSFRLRAMGSSSSTHKVDSGSGTSSATNGGKSSAPNSGPPSAQESSSTEENYSSIADSEWKRRLTKEQFNVARKKGTERAFTGEYWNTKTPGTYLCVCCSTPLFDSKTKFDSGTGWPSYWEPMGNNVKSETDWSIPYMPRTEVLCGKCDAHLGHVFNDGPRPTGKRYCINSVSTRKDCTCEAKIWCWTSHESFDTFLSWGTVFLSS